MFINQPYCEICCKKFEVNFTELRVCAGCLQKKPGVDIIRAVLEFSPEAKKIIHRFKYNDKTNLAKLFAGLINNRFYEDLKDAEVIVPVPMHRFKRLLRGYNPPQVLACELSKRLDKPLIPDLLIKKRMTKNQVGLNKMQRAKNLVGSFALNQKFDIKNKTILLVDDVLTTGATSNECSKILRKGGATKVKLVTIAKV